MADTNEHTGARLTTKLVTDAFSEGYERIFGGKKKKRLLPPWVLGEDATQVKQEEGEKSGGCCGGCC